MALLGALATGGCRKKTVEENPPPKPDAAGRMPMQGQGTVGAPGGGSGQAIQPQTD